jgi:hypothetical protein
LKRYRVVALGLLSFSEVQTKMQAQRNGPVLPVVVLFFPNVDAALSPTVRASLELAAIAFWTLKIIFSHSYLL